MVNAMGWPILATSGMTKPALTELNYRNLPLPKTI